MGNEVPQFGITRDEFLRNLRESGLNLAVELPADTEIDGTVFARQLVEDEKLTGYQAEAILARRFDDLLMGNYEILNRLGAGGMGAVFKARHRRMKRIVALKVLLTDVLRSEAFVQRFQREVETIARLTHPNIVMAFDADEGKAGPFLVMELVNGRDLATEVIRDGPLSVSDAVDCTLQATCGLEYAHAQGIVHRDIKPANLMRDLTGVVKVADLGLARLNASGSTVNTSLTQAGGIVGTMDYMSPEQALDSTAIDHRVDIYSLGCTLYFLLAGRPPYEAGSIMGVLLKHREAPIPSIAAVRPEVAPELEVIFSNMVAKKPEDRQQSMSEVVRVLEELKESVHLSDSRPVRQQPHLGSDTDLAGATIDFGSGVAAAARGANPAGLDATMGAAPNARDLGRVAGRKIVLAEPSRTQAGIIRKYLQQLGIENVHSTTTGREAIELAIREGADAIVCSMHLKDMTGVQLACALHIDRACSNVGLVLATSEADSGEMEQLPDNPRMVLMPKPFDLQRLAKSLATAVG